MGDCKMMKQSGLYFSLATMLLWGCNIVFSRYAIVNLGAHPYLFSTIVMFVGSMVLLLIAGKGAKVDESIKHPMTWFYSSLQILLNIGTLTALLYVTSTQSMLLQRSNIIIGLIVGLLFLNKKMSKNDFIGCLIIFSGVSLLLSTLEFKQAVSGMSAVLFAAICHVARTIIAEHHPVTKSSNTFSEYCRVLAYILLVTSTTFLLFALIVGFINSLDETIQTFSFLPSLNDMLTKEQLMFATGMGIFIMPLAMYCFFYGAQKAGMTNFLIYTAYLPVVTFILESIADYFNILEVPTLTYKDGISALAIMGGAFFISYYRNKSNHKNAKIAPKAKEDLEVMRRTIENTMEFCNDNEELVAKTLGIGKRTVKNIMTTQKAVSKDIKHKIIMNHAKNIAGLDHLTGALNQSSFHSKLKALSDVEKALVVFIDLDKFKPVNDTYGHPAGDSILKGVADRLMAEFKHPHIIARLGGDEFCAIIYGTDKKDEEKLANKIKQLVSESFIVEGIKDEISVGCSIGIAHYPTEGKNGLELKQIADKRMYKDKQINGMGR
jgi:diguanylate cyclase (GGDEF)-like protein